MAKKVSPIPEGCRTVTPYLCIKGADKAIDFYKKAFAAEEVVRMPGPGGQGVVHAELKIGDSMVFMSEEFPMAGTKSPKTLGGTSMSIMLYVPNCDAFVDRAVKAGATLTMPLKDMFWGDRFGKLQDPFGHEWAVATHIEDVPPEEMSKRSEAAMAEMAKQMSK